MSIPRNVLSISDFGLDVTEISTGVCDAATDLNVVHIVLRIYHIDSLCGLCTECRYRNNAKITPTGLYSCSERW